MPKNPVILQDVAWSFIGGPFPDRNAFELRLTQYQQAIRGTSGFVPGELTILSPAIRVQYMCWDGDEQIEPVITLAAENGAAFSVGDLMYQLHNAIVAQVDEIDHHFFEGLVLLSDRSDGQLPLYRLCQSS